MGEDLLNATWESTVLSHIVYSLVIPMSATKGIVWLLCGLCGVKLEKKKKKSAFHFIPHEPISNTGAMFR